MKCPECSTNLGSKTACPCGWKKEKTTNRQALTPCQDCGEVYQSQYLKHYAGREICADCLTIRQIPAQDRKYFEEMSKQFKFPVQDMPLHLAVANKKQMLLPEYLATLPRNRKEFEAQGGFDRLRELMT